MNVGYKIIEKARAVQIFQMLCIEIRKEKCIS